MQHDAVQLQHIMLHEQQLHYVMTVTHSSSAALAFSAFSSLQAAESAPQWHTTPNVLYVHRVNCRTLGTTIFQLNRR